MNKAVFLYLLWVVLITAFSWFTWWSLINNQLVSTYKLGDIFTLWRKFNEGFMMGAGVGLAVLLLLIASTTKESHKKSQSLSDPTNQAKNEMKNDQSN